MHITPHSPDGSAILSAFEAVVVRLARLTVENSYEGVV